MKYIRTLQNLKKIMGNAPELVEYKKYSEAYEEYIYKDESISFSIFCYEDDIKNITVNIDCEGISADLYYVMIGDEWVYDTSVSSKQKTMTEVNKVIRSIVSQIKDRKYIPIDEQRGCRDLTQEEKVEFIEWLKENGDAEGEEEASEAILNKLKDEKYTADGRFKNGKLTRVHFREDGELIFWWRLIEINKSTIAFVDTVNGYQTVIYGEAGKFEFEEKKEAEQLSKSDNAQASHVNQNDYTPIMSELEQKCRKVMEEHSKLVKAGRYYTARMLLDFLRTGYICLYFDDYSWESQEVLERAGFNIRINGRTGIASCSFER